MSGISNEFAFSPIFKFCHTFSVYLLDTFKYVFNIAISMWVIFSQLFYNWIFIFNFYRKYVYLYMPIIPHGCNTHFSLAFL